MDYELSDAEFNRLRALVYEVTGIKLAEAKRHMLRSRLIRRVRALNLASFREYHDFVKEKGAATGELSEFVNAVTTNKTDFYREPHHFDFVTERVIPEIARRKRQLRIWHAGCSTGEEPYTLSIALHEALPKNGGWDVKQLATDIDSNVLEHALRGCYDLERLAPIPVGLKQRYFLRGSGDQAGQARIKPILAEWLTFRRLNLLTEPWPFSSDCRFDLIFCRNVMIYFDKPTQQRLVERFYELLAPDGYLLIGHSESLFGISNGFHNLGKTIYKRVDILAEAA